MIQNITADQIFSGIEWLIWGAIFAAIALFFLGSLWRLLRFVFSWKGFLLALAAAALWWLFLSPIEGERNAMPLSTSAAIAIVLLWFFGPLLVKKK